MVCVTDEIPGCRADGTCKECEQYKHTGIVGASLCARKVKGVSMEQENIPQVIAESEIEIGDLKIRVMVLDNGQRVVPEEEFEKFNVWLMGRGDG